MLRRAVVGAAVVALVCTVLVGLLWALQRSLIYLPDAGPGLSAAEAVHGARDVVLETEDGLRLAAWYVPGPAPNAPAVLVANGNGGSRSLRAPLARALGAEGLAVLLFDYRGYAGNPGSPSEEGLGRDARAGRTFLVEETRVVRAVVELARAAG